MLSPKLTRVIAAGGAVVVVAIGGIAIANSTSSNGSSGAATVTQTPATSVPQSGQIPQNWRPGTGTIVTGAAADKAKAAALAAGYQGTVNRVLKLGDGSYAVHLFATSGPHHVFVSQDFKVTGTA
jgi:hypothetical protein